MANIIEQEIRVNLKAVLEGFNALKTVKKDIQEIFNNSKGELFSGAKSDTDELTTGINNLNSTVQKLPEKLAKANQESKGLVTNIRNIIETFGRLGEGIGGIIKLLNFFGITGDTVKQKVGVFFSFIKDNGASVAQGLKGIFSEISGSVSGAVSSGGQAASGIFATLRTSISSLAASASSALPAIAGIGAGLIAVGAVAAVVVAALLAVAAAITAVVGAIGGVAAIGTVGTAGLLALAQSGFEYLAVLEQIELGTGALIAQLSEINRNGLKLEGADKLEAGILLGREQLAKLRIDAINSTATFEQLADAFQAAVGSGLGAGLNLDQIRQITVSLAQAGAALGVPYNQLRQEINSILEGTIDINSRIAKNLGITNEEVKAWKAKGTLAEELNKKLASFNIAGIKAAQTLGGLKSNLQEALNVFTGEATTKAFETLKDRLSKILNSLFDFKNAGLDRALKPIADLIDRFLVQGINRFADWLETAIGYAKTLGGFIEENSFVINDILNLIDQITRDVVGLIGDMVGLSSDTNTWKSILNLVRSTLVVLSGLVKIVRDYTAEAADGFRIMGNWVLNTVIPAVDSLLSRIPGLMDLVNLMRRAANFQSSEDRSDIASGAGNDVTTDGLSYKGNKNAGAGGKKGKKNGEADRIKDALEDLEKTRIENTATRYRTFLKRIETDLEISYKNRLTSTADYYDKKVFISQQEITAELLKTQKLLALEEKKLATSKKRSEQIKAQAEIETLQTKIDELTAENNNKTKEVEQDRADALKELNNQYTELANVLKEIEGLGYEATVSRINEKYKEILEHAKADGKTEVVETINKIKEQERALAKLAENEKSYNQVLGEKQNVLDDIQEQLERGAINEEQAANRRIEAEREYKGELLEVIEAMILLAQKANDFDKVIALKGAKRKIQNSGDFTTPELLAQEQSKFDRLRSSLSISNRVVDNRVNRGDITAEYGDTLRLENERKIKAELQESVNLMRELAKATASLDDDIAVQNLALEIENLGEKTNTFGIGIIDALRSGLGGLFDDLLSGSKSISESFQSMIAGILTSIARLAANELLRSLFAGGLFKQGGALGFLAGLKFASGGHIQGAGTGTSDSIPIMASNGEYMIKAATVKKWGVGFFNWLNGGGNVGSMMGAFATGGLIGQATSGATDSNGGGLGRLRIVNVSDESRLKGFLQSSAGEEVLMNFFGRKGKELNQILIGN